MNSVKRSLNCGSLGNGLTVWDQLHEEHGDYQTVAHINRHREITYYVDLSVEDRALVESWAAGPNQAMSQTQPWMKVFDQ